MKYCWEEGDLRAYHDAELPAADMERVKAHLAECPECRGRSEEVSGRAGRVASLMGALPQPNQVMWMPRRPVVVVARRTPVWPVWAGAAAALAAGIAISLWVAPKREVVHAPQVATAAVAPAPIEQSPEAAPAAVPIVIEASAGARPTPVRRAARKPVVKPLFFVLDDEPFETGTVVRVALGEAEIPADVIFGADGRARAIRLVSNSSK